MNLLTIAFLTLREAVRRRILASVGVLTVIAVGLTTWGLWKLHSTEIERGDATFVLASFAILVLLLAYMFSVVLAVGTAFVAAPSIALDVDSGVMLALLPRPIRRSDVVLGKWLALTLLVTAYTFVVGALELSIIHAISGYMPPHPVRALAFLSAEAIALLTLALLLGTRLSPIAAGVVAVVLYGFTWVGGIIEAIALGLRNATLVHATTVLHLLVPTDVLWRNAAFSLEPAALAAAALTDVSRESPFTVGAPPPPAFLWWCLGWIIAVLVAAVVSFQRRDL